ncbi:thioesterase family protein, partial [Patulibacter sp. S7RM1-6]
PAPASVAPADLSRRWPGGYIAALDFRPVRGPEPGRTAAWLRTDVALLPDEPVGDLARYVALVDTANGIAVRASPEEWLFPNLDLTIHLHEQPTGPWVGLDTTVIFGAGGLGLTETVLHDERGPVGRAAQSLTLRPRG